MANTHDLLVQILSIIQNEGSDLSAIPARDIISSVYVELQAMKQLFTANHMDRLESSLVKASVDLKAALDSGNRDLACRLLHELIEMHDFLPDAEETMNFIEQANFDHAFLRHRKERTIIVLGDSHVNYFSGNEMLSFIPIGNFVDTCDQVNGLPLTCLHLGACLAFNSNRYGSSSGFREKLDWLLNSFILPDAPMIISMGEIDIRAHVVKQAGLQGKSNNEIVDSILKNYLEFLTMLQQQGHRITCWGPIASQKDSCPLTPDHPRVGSEKERNQITAYFNRSLEEICKDNGFGFISLFSQMVTDDYETRPEYLSADQFHLGQFSAGALHSMISGISE
jgi:hypothetical protein